MWSRVGARLRVTAAATLTGVVAAYAIAAVLSGSDGPGAPAAHGATAEAGWMTLAPPGASLLVRTVDDLAPRADGAAHRIDPGGQRSPLGGLECKRVHGVRGGPHVCLRVAGSGADYEAVVHGGDAEVRRLPVDGVPDRARVSPDGTYLAYTSFDPAESQGYFESPDEFSTYTRILDLRTGKILLRLEDIQVYRRGRRFPAEEAEFWGVTFGSGGTFFATIANGDTHHLVAGRVDRRRVRLVATDVECPALSPDGQRIAYKHRIGYDNRWRLRVMDLSTRRRTILAERRSVDDQPEWLNDEWVVYSDDRAVFAVRADGTGKPVRLVENATSPAVLAPLPAAGLDSGADQSS